MDKEATTSQKAMDSDEEMDDYELIKYGQYTGRKELIIEDFTKDFIDPACSKYSAQNISLAYGSSAVRQALVQTVLASLPNGKPQCEMQFVGDDVYYPCYDEKDADGEVPYRPIPNAMKRRIDIGHFIIVNQSAAAFLHALSEINLLKALQAAADVLVECYLEIAGLLLDIPNMPTFFIDSDMRERDLVSKALKQKNPKSQEFMVRTTFVMHKHQFDEFVKNMCTRKVKARDIGFDLEVVEERGQTLCTQEFRQFEVTHSVSLKGNVLSVERASSA